MNDELRALPIRGAVCLASLALLLGCTGPRARKAQPAPAPIAAAPAPAAQPAQPPSANLLLQDMARFLAAARKFSVEVYGQYDVLQDNGQMIEFSENRRLLVNRPDGLVVHSEQSDGDTSVLYYDGRKLTVFSPHRQVYAQTAKPGGIDGAVKFFLHDLHMRMPLALMLQSDFPAELAARTGEANYVERTVIYGQPAHHIAGRTPTVDYQFWIAEGAKPLPLRVVLTYTQAEGKPQFRGHFRNWNLAPKLTPATFSFTPPEGARKIAFLAELPQIGRRAAAAPAPQGEQK